MTQEHHEPEHAFAHAFGFYRKQLWWIDTFTIHPGRYYRFHITGTNGMRQDEWIHWRVPTIVGTSYAFRLQVIE